MVTSETAVAIEQMRIGLFDAGNSASNGFGTIDVAEILIYDKALTAQVTDFGLILCAFERDVVWISV